ncbi:MAG: glycosyltransferase [Bacteroidetes bacterium GWF2_33_16]|nr:MAG: glycosyltransferase [Bacteroidetes bacterium GWE2_32_14]OFY03775.1 MAG: glycosyltransferase [Bacteroidetes bacterium GWF2_33_16]
MLEAAGKYKEVFEQRKCCVIIPTYNNEKTLDSVIKGVLEYTNQVIVVNDGSTDSTSQILSTFTNIDIVSYSKNKGKGFALRKGLRFAWEKGYKYAITIDSDGQHYVTDLPKFLEKLNESPNAIIIGSRNMDQSSVPGKSSFGHKFSNFWFKFETGISSPDTQSGFRLYPLEPLSRMIFFTRKYEFEIEVIVRAAWKGVEVTSVPIQVYYAPKETRVSHFRPFRDFTRVSILNTILVFYALLVVKPFKFIRSLNRKNIQEFYRKQILQNEEPNHKIVFALMLGLFMGVAPVWGYQMLIAFGIAHLLKLNKVIVIVASNISIPPMIPIILFASFKTGGLFIEADKLSIIYSSDISLNMIKDNLLQYLLGSLAFGVILAITIGIISYLLLTFFRKNPQLQEEFVNH